MTAPHRTGEGSPVTQKPRPPITPSRTATKVFPQIDPLTTCPKRWTTTGSRLKGRGRFSRTHSISASPDAANQNAWIAALEEALKGDKYSGITLVETVYGNDQSEMSYNRALGLVDKHPNLGLIMSPTTVGIQATAKAMQDEGLCDQIKVSGLGLPSEMVSYTMNGCAPEFALWDFRDLGYLTYYTAYGIENAVVIDNTGAWRDEAGLGEHLNLGAAGCADAVVERADKLKGAVIEAAKAAEDALGFAVPGTGDDIAFRNCRYGSGISVVTLHGHFVPSAPAFFAGFQ